MKRCAIGCWPSLVGREALALAGVLVVALAGCGGHDSKPVHSSDLPPAPTVTQEPASTVISCGALTEEGPPERAFLCISCLAGLSGVGVATPRPLLLGAELADDRASVVDGRSRCRTACSSCRC